MIARKNEGIAIESLTPLSIRSTSKLTSGQRLSLHRSSTAKIFVSGEKKSRITFELKIENRQWRRRVSLVEARYEGYIYLTLKDQGQKLSSGQGHVMTDIRSCCISVDAS